MKKSKILVNSFFEEIKLRRTSIYKFVRNLIILCIVLNVGNEMYSMYKGVEYTPETLNYYTSVASEIWNDGLANSSFEAQNISFNFNEIDSIRLLNEGLANLPHDDVSLALTLEDGCKVLQKGDMIVFEPSFSLDPRIKVDFSKEEMSVSTYEDENIIPALIFTVIIFYFILQFIWLIFYKFILRHIVDFVKNVFIKYHVALEIEERKNLQNEN